MLLLLMMMMMMTTMTVVSSGLMETQTQIIRKQTLCHCEEKSCAAKRTAS
jgi:hypothetical protein